MAASAQLCTAHLSSDIVASSLNEWLPTRQSQETLEQRHIVPLNYFIDPISASNGQQLVRDAIMARLDEFHENRPSLADLHEKNIRYVDDCREHVLISGFVRELFEHDPVALGHTPQDIYKLVERYYNEMKLWERERTPTKAPQDPDDINLLQRRPTITDLGDMHIIPHDYLDNLLEEAVAEHQRRESRMDHVQRRLQRHLPEPVAQTLAETLISSLPNDSGDQDGDENGGDGLDNGTTGGVPQENSTANSNEDIQNNDDEEWQISFVYDKMNDFVPMNPDQQENVVQTLERRLSLRPSQQEVEMWGFVPPQYFEQPDDFLRQALGDEIGNELGLLSDQRFDAEDYLKMSTSTTLKGDDARCTFKHSDLPLFAMPQDIQIVGDVVVHGFIDELFDFDPIKLDRTPKEIYLLVHRYYMMMAPLLEEGNPKTSYRGKFEWRFHDEAAISMFADCQKDDVLKSAPFMVNECVFHLELSPNGRGDVVKEGECTLWLAVDSLPPKIEGVAVRFDIYRGDNGLRSYNDIVKGILHEPGSGEVFGFGNSESMEFSRVKALGKWQFEIEITLTAMQQEDGTMRPLQRDTLLSPSDGQGLIPDTWMIDLYEMADEVRGRHRRMESAVEDLKGLLNVPPILADVVANDVLNEMEAIDPQLIPSDGQGPGPLMMADPVPSALAQTILNEVENIEQMDPTMSPLTTSNVEQRPSVDAVDSPSNEELKSELEALRQSNATLNERVEELLQEKIVADGKVDSLEQMVRDLRSENNLMRREIEELKDKDNVNQSVSV